MNGIFLRPRRKLPPDRYYGRCYSDSQKRIKSVFVRDFRGLREGVRLTVEFRHGFTAQCEGCDVYISVNSGAAAAEVRISAADGVDMFDNMGYIASQGGTVSFIYHDGSLSGGVPYFSIDAPMYVERSIMADSAEVAAAVEPGSVGFAGLAPEVKSLITRMNNESLDLKMQMELVINRLDKAISEPKQTVTNT